MVRVIPVMTGFGRDFANKFAFGNVWNVVDDNKIVAVVSYEGTKLIRKWGKLPISLVAIEEIINREQNPEDSVFPGDMFDAIGEFDVMVEVPVTRTSGGSRSTITVKPGDVIQYIGPLIEQRRFVPRLRFRLIREDGSEYTFNARRGYIDDFIERIQR